MENETRYCPKCGTMITSGGSCSNCGWKSNASQGEHSKLNKYSFLMDAMDKAEDFRNVKVFFSILGIIAGIVVIIMGHNAIDEIDDLVYFDCITIGIGILIILKSLFFLLHSITSYQHMNFQYFLAKSFLEEKKASDENINETIKTFFEDSDSK